MKIPVNPEFLTTEYSPCDDSIPYEVMIRKMELNNEPDKNGNQFLKAQYTIVSPEEWKDRVIFDNYIVVPEEPTPNMSSAERRMMQDQGVRFMRFAKCFKIDLAEGFDTGEVLGKFGHVTIKNDEYEGRISSRVKEYLF